MWCIPCITQFPNSLVAQTLKAKYLPSCWFWDAPCYYNPSAVWRSIWWACKALERGCRWLIGLGDKVNIWRDHWLPTPTTCKPITPYSSSDAHLQVKDLIDADSRQWQEDLIRAKFYDHDANIICQIPLCRFPVEDRLAWHYTNNGIYFTKSGYHLIKSQQLTRTTYSSC